MWIKPNYPKASSEAKKILYNTKIPKLPVDIISIIKEYKNLRTLTYTAFANLNNLNINDVVAFANSESGCCYWMKEQDRYLILYNDTINSNGHIRWTLAHEFGHYILKHCANNNETLLSRSNLTDEKYNILEKEANHFAKMLLAPYCFIHALNVTNIHEIVRYFDLSFSAASFTYSGYINYMHKILNPFFYDKELLNKYEQIINRTKNLLYCLTCNNEFSIKNAQYCPICGSNKLFIEGVSNTMKYSEINVNEKGKAIICPYCENENTEITGDYCQICGNLISNKCVADNGYPCCEESNALTGDARFCPYCGHETSFNIYKLLKPWKDEPPIKDEDLSFLA